MEALAGWWCQRSSTVSTANAARNTHLCCYAPPRCECAFQLTRRKHNRDSNANRREAANERGEPHDFASLSRADFHIGVLPPLRAGSTVVGGDRFLLHGFFHTHFGGSLFVLGLLQASPRRSQLSNASPFAPALRRARAATTSEEPWSTAKES
jgi:hypothetical protein